MNEKIRKRKEKAKLEEKTNEKFVVGLPGQRWIAGIFDLILLISIHTIIVGYFKGTPFFFNIAINYFISYSDIIPTLLSPSNLASELLFFCLAFPYFLIEGLLGVSLGKSLMGLRVAGKRSLSAVSVRAFIRSISPFSLIDFLFIYRNTKYNQRFSDKILELSVAMFPVKQKSRLFLLDKTDWKYIITGLFVWLMPLISILSFYLINANSINIGTAPSPNSAFNYEPTMNILLEIIVNNVYLAYVYYGFGAIFFLIPTIMQIVFQSYLAGVMISADILSNWLFVLYGLLPHMILECLGFSFCVASGLVISETVLNLLEKYFKGKSLDDTRTYFSYQMKKIFRFSLWGIIFILVAAFIETYLTPMILTFYYFH